MDREQKEKQQRRNSQQSKNRQIIDAYDYLANAVSTTDCTGLIPEGEGGEDELERYQEIYKFGAPPIDWVDKRGKMN